MFEGEKRCASWDFQTKRWVTDGCDTFQLKDSFLCKCSHLTNFAILIVSAISVHILIIYVGIFRMFVLELKTVQQMRK